uniref:G_PROTEIN_RECEP_F1_2 domain-containing protein n=1 Tax=Macrostomum lignano TaxID=282301 RepID=A0A1I8FZS2_9PLAT
VHTAVQQPMDLEQPHDHALDAQQLHGGAEQSAVYAVASLSLISNVCLIGVVLIQRQTRRLRLAFLLHSAFLNLLLSGLAFAFGNGLRPGGISSDSCRNLTTSYIIFQTVWVFNLIPVACCEIYYLDGGSGRPRGSTCCVAFGIALVYTCSAILHLGPTLIGANFDWSASDARCVFLHGHKKNYTVALGVTAYYLASFRRSIDESMRCRLRNAALRCLQKRRQRSASEKAAEPGAHGFAAAAATMAESMLTSDVALASRLADLAALRTNRQRVLCGICGICVLCWYPLYLLVLSDPHFKAPVALYHLFTVLGFAKTLFEPLCVLAFDRTIARPLMKLWPCTWHLRYVSEEEIDDRLVSAAAAGCPERSDSISGIASVSTSGRRVGGGGEGGRSQLQAAGSPAPLPPILHQPQSAARPMMLHSRAAQPRFLLTTPNNFVDQDDFDQLEQRQWRSPTPPEVFSPSSPLGYY